MGIICPQRRKIKISQRQRDFISTFSLNVEVSNDSVCERVVGFGSVLHQLPHPSSSWHSVQFLSRLATSTSELFLVSIWRRSSQTADTQTLYSNRRGS